MARIVSYSGNNNVRGNTRQLCYRHRSLGFVLIALLAFLNNALRPETAALERNGLLVPRSILTSEHLSLTFYPNNNGEKDDQVMTTNDAHSDKQRGKPKMLIAQYDAGSAVSSEHYMKILNATSTINRAYADKYRHDYLLLRGYYLLPPKWPFRGRVNQPAAALATYNKLALLHVALENEQYTSLLLLDSDAMIVDFTVDIASAYSMHSSRSKRGQPDDILLVAQRVSGNNNSWDVNAGVMLWNLKHALVRKVVSNWERRCKWRVSTGASPEDQKPLHTVLRRLGNSRPVLAHGGNDFRYADGTVIKHFVRPVGKSSWNENAYDNSKRLYDVMENVQRVCSAHNVTACKDQGLLNQ